LLILLFAALFTSLSAQYVNVVCAGDTGVVYRVAGTECSTFKWSVEGGTIVSDWGDSIKVNWGEVAGEYELRVQEFSIHDCPAVPVTATVLVSAPDIDLGADREICEGDFIEIDPVGTFYSYLWQNGSTNNTLVSSTEGYKKVKVTDEYGCEWSDSIYLAVHPLPYVELGRDTSLCGTESLILDGGSDGMTYNWSTGESFREITVYQGYQLISLEVIDENNCSSSDSILINVCDVEDQFKEMPTAFTPNGDGKNDVWRIPELEPFPMAVVEIYDRWGNLLFRSEPGYSNPWDGIANDGRTMPMDSYYFVIDFGEQNLDPLAGTVTLIR